MKNFKFFDSLKTKIIELKQKNKRVFFACIALAIIGIILLFSIIVSAPKKQNKAKSSNAEQFSVTEYAASVEKKIQDMILSLDSVSSASVFVMIESTPQTKYLTEQSTDTKTTETGTNSTLSETVVFEKNGSISTPVVVTVIMPKITGVLIVTNSISTSTKLSIISSISIVLNIDESRISLLQEK